MIEVKDKLEMIIGMLHAMKDCIDASIEALNEELEGL